MAHLSWDPLRAQQPERHLRVEVFVPAMLHFGESCGSSDSFPFSKCHGKPGSLLDPCRGRRQVFTFATCELALNKSLEVTSQRTGRFNRSAFPASCPLQGLSATLGLMKVLSLARVFFQAYQIRPSFPDFLHSSGLGDDQLLSST